MTTGIPLIDLRDWRGGDATGRSAVAGRMDRALQSSGFLMIDGHGGASGRVAPPPVP
jgi:isopenicillin N synthase-like dioxygenase